MGKLLASNCELLMLSLWYGLRNTELLPHVHLGRINCSGLGGKRGLWLASLTCLHEVAVAKIYGLGSNMD